MTIDVMLCISGNCSFKVNRVIINIIEGVIYMKRVPNMQTLNSSEIKERTKIVPVILELRCSIK